jgi:predicted ATP-binding protein involved in virulence
MYIEKATIKNIKSIRHLEITFAKPAGWHVIIGDNGSGKSSILKAIALALIGANEAAALRLNLNDYINFQSNIGKVELELDLDSKNLNINRSINQNTGRIISERELVNVGIKIEREKDSDFAQLKTINPKKNAFLKRLIWENRTRRGVYSSSFGPFRRFSGGNREWEKVFYSNPKMSNHLSVFGEGVALTESIEWLIQLNYKKLEGSLHSRHTLGFLERFINQSDLLPHNAKIKEITSEGVFFTDAYNEKVNLTEMSDGFRSILSMTFEIIRQMSKTFGISIFRGRDKHISLEGIVMIDEIDAHLHPTWQTKIGNWFTKHFPNIQFIVTTHSPLICRAAENGSIWQLAEPGSNDRIREIIGLEKERLVNGNILDAYGTELFGQSPVRSAQSDVKLKRLGQLNMYYALGQLSEIEVKERLELQKILTTDDPTGF